MFKSTTYTALLLFLCTCGPAPDGEVVKEGGDEGRQRPNIIFIMDDQHRYDAIGNLNPQVLTPTLDSLMDHGVLYEQAVCQAPMCVPSRNSIMFGMYPSQTGVFRNSGGVPDDALPGKTMAQYFREAGYETAGFGKTHWGRHRTDTRGFETRYTSEIPEEGGVLMADVAPEAKARYDAEIAEMGPGEENNVGYLGFTSALPESDHRDGWVNERAIDYIRGRDDERPLFLYLSYMKPHAGHNPPAGYEARYDTADITYAEQPPWTEDYAPHAAGVNRRELYEPYWKSASPEQWKLMTMRYYANVSWIDEMMGRILAELRRKGLLDNALVVYTSDHGESLGEHYYRFNKYSLYEASIRVPLIVSGSALPPDYEPGTVDHRPVDLVDILPTVLDAAGIPVPDALPGVDLLADPAREGGFAALHEREGEAAFMWRTPQAKLILVFERQARAADYRPEHLLTGEFYDLVADPAEWHDRYGDAEVAELEAEFRQKILAKLSAM
ncbi:Ulvan-active sulfatase [Neolewinella maritima]|uniref:Ulvan-active sulfatase n=1 Tax=Neolewinella maritima TaxID=1383882 RepID=A0ABM9B3E3_9BACT|nr:sulfatase-like hydrolase/transferase [Neolewinella maritima]CAH1001847.1 Ulvan-active sulfatase [Neolewinella maritima]